MTFKKVSFLSAIILSLLTCSPSFSSDFSKSKADDKWLTKAFSTMNPCYPKPDIYYDSKLKKSTVLAQHGYRSATLNIPAALASYSIHEKFYGLTASELIIPIDDTLAKWIIKVQGPAALLKANIKRQTGFNIATHYSKNKHFPEANDGVAEILSTGKETYIRCYNSRN